jgi:hypothetical protein
VAAQLGIAEPTGLRQYGARPATQSAHMAAIRRQYGYRSFGDQPEHFRLVRWLYVRAWLSPERPSELFAQATAYLIEHKVLLPGASVLARLVRGIRDRANVRLWRTLARLPSPEQKGCCRPRLAHLAPPSIGCARGRRS